MEHPAIHIGQNIASVLASQGRTARWLAQQLHCDRTNVYDIFRRTAIDTELLLRISLTLQHDFFQDLSEVYAHSHKH